MLLRAASYSDSDNIAFSRCTHLPRAFVRVKRIGQTAQPVYCAKICCSSSLAGTPPLATRCSISFSFWMAAIVGVKLFARRCRQIIQIGGFIGNRFAVVRFIFCRKAFHICHNLRDKGAGFFDDLAIDGFNSFLRLRLLTWLFRGRPRCIFGVGRKQPRKFFMLTARPTSGKLSSRR